jgi:hypothetical protein
VGFESTISALKRVETVHALDCAATVTGYVKYQHGYFFASPQYLSYIFKFLKMLSIAEDVALNGRIISE